VRNLYFGLCAGGEVVAVGEGRTIGDKKIEPSVSKGAQIVYSKYAGTEVDFNGESHLLLKEDDVVGLLSTDDVKDLQPANDRVLIAPRRSLSLVQ
jgi:chaperonin GroES